jgi:hypothetical protein
MASPYSAAATDLSLTSLTDQLAGETEEERKKRLADEAQRKALGPLATPYGMASRTLGLGSYGSANVGRSGGY